MSNAVGADKKMVSIARGRLNQRTDLNVYLNKVLLPFIRADERIEGSPVHETKPRFDILTELAKRTNFFVYDHPAVAKAFGKTAFTDGINAYFYAGFLDELLAQEEWSGFSRFSVVPVALHELAHKLLGHCSGSRLANEDPRDVNIAMDVGINANLILSYSGRFPFGEVFDKAWGADNPIKWASMSTEAILEELRKQSQAQKSQQQRKQSAARNAQSGQGGQVGQSGQDGPGAAGGNNQQAGKSPGDGGRGNAGGQGSGAAADDSLPGSPGAASSQTGTAKTGGSSPTADDGSSDFNKGSEGHTIRPQDLARVLEQNPDIAHVRDALGYPDSRDSAAYSDLLAEAAARVENSIRAAASIRNRTGSRSCGSHMDQYAERELEHRHDPVLTFRQALQKCVLGGGHRMEHTMGEPGDLYHLDMNQFGLNLNIWEGALTIAEPKNTVIVVNDTSGSVSDDMLDSFFGEIGALVSNHRDRASRVLVYSADTTLRDKCQEVTPRNYRQIMKQFKAYGGGGTDMESPLVALLNDPKIQRMKPSAILVFSDLEVGAPRREMLPSVIPPILFFHPEGCENRKFASAVEHWADVYPISPKVVVDLERARHRSGLRM